MTSYFSSPVGWLELSTSESALKSIRYSKEPVAEQVPEKTNSIIHHTRKELTEYFSGDRKEFNIPLDPDGTTFQKKVWSLLKKISYGQTTTYGALADKLGDPNKVRAVGKANGNNPIPIIIPCHRIIGSGNRLVGYAGGIERKRFLLQHEGAVLL